MEKRYDVLIAKVVATNCTFEEARLLLPPLRASVEPGFEIVVMDRSTVIRVVEQADMNKES